MHSAIVFVNKHKENSHNAATEISDVLGGRGIKVTVFSFDGCPGTAPEGSWDIAFSLGGDGTVLYTARIMAASGTPILPIHLGTLGFLAGVQRHEWIAVYDKWVNHRARISPRCMLALSVQRNGGAVFESACLNDIVIASSGIAKLVSLGARAETASGEFADLGCYRSDGLIIATPTGSTAYAMAAGGPILEPEMEALIVCPICPFSLSNRPLVLPSRQPLLVRVEKEQRSSLLLTVDGQGTFALEPEDTIAIRQSPHYARLITTGRSAYYAALKEKLSWAAHTWAAHNGGDHA